MSDRYKSLTVVLDADYPAEDVLAVMQCIRCLRGVADVTMEPVDSADFIARMQLAASLQPQIHEAIRQVFTQDAIRKKAGTR